MPDSNEFDWEDYEELVRDIYEVLGQDSGVTIECWGRNCRVIGLSGSSHQIDVLTRHSDGLHEYRTAISCKYWEDPVGIGDLRELSDIVRDANLSRGIIVAKHGFTDPAHNYARSQNIGLVELRKPRPGDLPLAFEEIHLDITYERADIDNLRLALVSSEEWAEERGLREGVMGLRHLADRMVFETPGQQSKTLREIIRERSAEDPSLRDYKYDFPEGSIVTVPDNPEEPIHGCLVTDVIFTVEHSPPMNVESIIRPRDHIYMIMEALFEGRRYIITNDGRIVEQE